MKFIKKPIEVEALPWFDDNVEELYNFTNGNFRVINQAQAIEHFEDELITAAVFDELHSTWVGIKSGQWIIRGVEGEFYPIDDEVLWKTYYKVEE